MMALQYDTMNRMRDVLAKLYLDTDSARRVAVEAGLNPEYIKFDRSALNTWQSVIDEAARNDKLQAVLDVAMHDYPEQSDLRHLAEELRREPEGSSPRPTEGESSPPPRARYETQSGVGSEAPNYERQPPSESSVSTYNAEPPVRPDASGFSTQYPSSAVSDYQARDAALSKAGTYDTQPGAQFEATSYDTNKAESSSTPAAIAQSSEPAPPEPDHAASQKSRARRSRPAPAKTGEATGAAQAKPAPSRRKTAAPSKPPAEEASPGQVAVTNIQLVDLSMYRPPDRNRQITFRVRRDNARIESDNQACSSKAVFDPDALLQSQLRPQEYGELLFSTIVNNAPLLPGVNDTDFGYRTAMQPGEEIVRFELIMDPPDESLNGYAWEYLRPPSAYGNSLPLAVRERSPFYRKLDFPVRSLHVREGTLKVLVAICNPPEVGATSNEILGKLTPLQVSAEAEIMEGALKRLADSGLLRYRILGRQGEKVTIETITQALQEDGGYHVLHLLGHGVFTQHRPPDNYFLVIARQDGKLPFVSADEFQTVLAAGSLRLVVLASCNSAVTQSGDALRGLGPQLVKCGVPAVIAMQRDMPIDAAQFFTQHFYDDLARSGRVDMAMAATRLALFQRDAKRLDWGIPVLFFGSYQDADWGQLFDPNPTTASSFAKLTPDVRTYDRLGVSQDPTVRSMLQLAQAQATAIGAPQMAQALQQRMAAAIGEAPALAVRQNREAIDLKLDLPARLTPAGLAQHIATKSTLKLPKNTSVQIAAALATGKHVILIGPPGTGKTTLANVVCAYAEELGLCDGVVATTATADWSTFDTVGGYAPSADQTLQFKSGCFLDAIAQARWLIIDEINRAEIDKAFGELFTVLSGQQVVLPYTVGADRVRILPPDTRQGARGWIPAEARPAGCDYVVHPNWRIIGTMNVYDKSSLFSMSLAFMRRFAFVDLDLPDDYAGLRKVWLDGDPVLTNSPDRPDLERVLDALLAREEGNVLMQKRALGPAIVRDILNYVSARYPDRGTDSIVELLAEALVLYAAPQLDGLDRQSIVDIHTQLGGLFGGVVAEERGLLPRVRALYPFIDTWK